MANVLYAAGLGALGVYIQQRASNGQEQLQLDQGQAQLAQGQEQLARDQAQLAQDQAQLAQGKEQVTHDQAELVQGKTQLEKDNAAMQQQQAQLQLREEQVQLREGQVRAELDGLNATRALRDARDREDDKQEKLINSEILVLSVSISEQVDAMVAISASAEEETPSTARSPQPDGSDIPKSDTAVIVASQSAGLAGSASAITGPDSGQLKRNTVSVSLQPVLTRRPKPQDRDSAENFQQQPQGVGCRAVQEQLDPIGRQQAVGLPHVGGLDEDKLKFFNRNPKVSVVGRYKSGKSTLVMMLLGYPNRSCLQDPIVNTKGMSLYVKKAAGQPVLIDVEGFAQPLTTMDPYFLRELAMQFCVSVSRCIILVVNQIDLADLLLINNIRNIARGVIVVVLHNLMTISRKADMDAYKQQIMRSLHLEQGLINDFALSNKDGTEVHYVIGDLVHDSEWNVKLGLASQQETVFDVIRRMHCNGDSVQHDLEKDLQAAFSKAVSKYFEPVRLVTPAPATATANSSFEAARTPAAATANGYFSEQKWVLVDDDARPATKVLQATYVTLMRRAFTMHNLQPHSSITVFWMRNDTGAVVYLVVNCPGFVLTDLKFLKGTGLQDEHTILLIGTQHIYGRRIELPIRELLRAPVPLIQTPEEVSLALTNRLYDGNGSLILSLKPNAKDADVMEVLQESTVFTQHSWSELDHRIQGPASGSKQDSGSAAKPCDCKMCVTLQPRM